MRYNFLMYKLFIKRILDVILSLSALLVLAVPMLIFMLIIKREDRGSAFFTQRRIGKHKKIFLMYKFRSMKTNTPHDTPTHLLKKPEQYITGVGRFLRKSSLDELPQIWDIFVGNMSIVGPRPALWNQDDLIAERDKYGANDVRPGLTGWAQINGRDELEIEKKAKLDGEYVAILKQGGLDAFLMDAKCFFRTFVSVAKHEGIVEGGTGALGSGK